MRRLLVGLGLVIALALACQKKDTPAPSPSSSGPAAAAPPVSTALAAPSASSDVVSAASVETYDAGPRVMTGASIDGAALRKRHVERLKSDRSPVTLLTGGSALELGRAICEAVMPWRPKSTPILLKPNLCGFDSIKDPAKSKGDDGVAGRTTGVEFTRGVVHCLKKRGHDRITIAEGCGISHAHWQKVTEITGYAAMAREEAVSLVALDDDGVFDVEGEKPALPLGIGGIENTRIPKLLIPKILAEHLDHGLFVSLPKVKTHRYSVTSMAIKGMQGTVMLSDARPAYKQKFRMHRELNAQLKAKREARAAAKAADAGPLPPADPVEQRKAYVASLLAFGERMVDMLELEAPDVVLADGAPAMGGDGFQVLYPSKELMAVGGTNPVLVDRVGAEVLGLHDNQRLASELGGHSTSPLIELAARRFGLDLGATKVVGSGAALLSSPRPVHFRSMAGFEIHSEAPRSTETPKPSLTAAALGDGAVVIDGKPDDAIWSRAVSASWNTDFAGAPTPTETQARFAWSPKGLYVLFEVEGTAFNVDRSRPVDVERDKLYQEDCVELFLGHDPADRRHYLEVELGPFGHFFDLDVRLGGKSDTAWSSGVTVRTTRDEAAKRAVIEAKLTAPAITAVLRSGARLPLGLYRMEGKAPRQYLAWSPPRTRKPNFHVPDAFGVLVLE